LKASKNRLARQQLSEASSNLEMTLKNKAAFVRERLKFRGFRKILNDHFSLSSNFRYTNKAKRDIAVPLSNRFNVRHNALLGKIKSLKKLNPLKPRLYGRFSRNF